MIVLRVSGTSCIFAADDFERAFVGVVVSGVDCSLVPSRGLFRLRYRGSSVRARTVGHRRVSCPRRHR